MTSEEYENAMSDNERQCRALYNRINLAQRSAKVAIADLQDMLRILDRTKEMVFELVPREDYHDKFWNTHSEPENAGGG